jgi:nucleoside-diphosphate-sugar epimerase
MLNMSFVKKPHILVTGANGFVGRALCRRLSAEGFPVRQAVRNNAAADNLSGDVVVVGDIGPDTEWQEALRNIEVVVHLAARVHMLHESGDTVAAVYRHVNRDGTIRLAEQAARAGVRRLIFLSSIKVNGEGTRPGQPYTEADTANPQDPYGISKWEAEEILRQMDRRGVIETVIVRPPLIYGPGVGANFLRLIKLVDRGLPLPFGHTANKRSLIAVENLCDFLLCCITHPAASGHTFLVSDGKDLSTTELVQLIGQYLGKIPPLLPVPYGLMRFPAALLNREELVTRLWGSLQVDINKAQQLLGWHPPIPVNTGIHETIQWYQHTRRQGEQTR